MTTVPTLRRPRQRGFTLLEALIAFLVLALGLVALAQLPKQLRLRAEVARQHGEAVRLAQSEVETLRAFAVIEDAIGLRSFDAIAPASRAVDTNGTHYTLTRRVADDPTTAAKRVAVELTWTDRSSNPQVLTLASVIARESPALGAALGLARTESLARGAAGRSPRIPILAKDLGNGRSALKLEAAGDLALLLDNVTGLVVGRCTGIDPGIATRDLTTTHLGPCDTTAAGLLITGTVRFTAAVPPDPSHANDAPLPFTMVAQPTTGTDPIAALCGSEAMKAVAVERVGGRHLEVVPIAALPALLGVATWTDTGERFARYHCAVFPGATARWSGRTIVQPSGWSLGTVDGAWRVCRYTSDLDRSGAIDANAEHPADYRDLTTSLTNQNFLVVSGSAACPTGNNTGLSVDVSTAPHQP
ncbi:type IV pilus modification PilV family protein [Rhizobacter fulvus]